MAHLAGTIEQEGRLRLLLQAILILELLELYWSPDH